LLPSLQATIAVIPPVEVTAALTSAAVAMHEGHITRLPALIHPAFRFGHHPVCDRHDDSCSAVSNEVGVTSLAGFQRLVD
jgi:hypothetical protein